MLIMDDDFPEIQNLNVWVKENTDNYNPIGANEYRSVPVHIDFY